jgi:TonB family protein
VSTSFSRRLTVALFILPLAHGVVAAEVPQPVRTPPKALVAASAAATELQAAVEAGPHLGRNLERLSSFQHAPETAAALRDAFGNERPWSFEQRGVRSYRFTVLPLRHTLDTGALASWSAFPLDMTVDKSGQRLNYSGKWPEASFEYGGTKIALSGVALDGKQRRGKGDLWFGDVGVDIGRLSIRGGPAAPQQSEVRMNGLRFVSRTVERARTVDVSQRTTIASFEVAGERVDNITMAYRFEHLDKAALVRLAAAAKQRQASTLGQRQALEELTGTMRQFLRAAASHKSGLVIERISASYGGHTAVLSGRLGVKGVQEADFSAPKLLLKRIDGRFEIAVPVALVRAVSLSAARRQAAAQGKANVSEQELQAMAQSITDVMLGKALGDGFARLEKDVLRTTIEIRNGVVRVNGKPLDLPKPAQPTPGPGPAAPGHANMSMPARRIDGSCTLPDYPERVIAGDAPLALTLRVTVDTGGMPREVEVVAPSEFPDYDQALQAAIKTCRYFPALSGNLPVAQSVTWKLVREAGSKRP